MREKRKKEKEQKIEELEKSQANKIKNSTKPKKIRDIEKYYQKKKQELLENEKQFGLVEFLTLVLNSASLRSFSSFRFLRIKSFCFSATPIFRHSSLQ